MNPKRVHFRPGPGFSNPLLGILRNCWVSSDVVSDVYSFAKEIRNDYETQNDSSRHDDEIKFENEIFKNVNKQDFF